MSWLAVDTASPTVSVALGDPNGRHASRSMPQSSSSRELLPAIESLFEELGLEPAALGGVLAVRGPGSFTGLRVGLATVLGLHQAIGLRCAARSTLEVLAAAVPDDRPTLAVVDALRDEWFVQEFGRGPHRSPDAPPVRLTREELGRRLAATLELTVVGHTAERAAARLGLEPARVVPVETLAPWLLSLAPGESEWRWQELSEPLYLRSPAVTLPASPPGR